MKELFLNAQQKTQASVTSPTINNMHLKSVSTTTAPHTPIEGYHRGATLVFHALHTAFQLGYVVLYNPNSSHIFNRKNLALR